jgi:hypothetical protein
MKRFGSVIVWSWIAWINVICSDGGQAWFCHGLLFDIQDYRFLAVIWWVDRYMPPGCDLGCREAHWALLGNEVFVCSHNHGQLWNAGGKPECESTWLPCGSSEGESTWAACGSSEGTQNLHSFVLVIPSFLPFLFLTMWKKLYCHWQSFHVW